MMNSSELKNRTKQFAYECIDLALDLGKSPLERHVQGQLIRCSTSVAANYRAACHGQTRAAFVAKLSIVVEESDESEFWLQMILDKIKPENSEVSRLLGEANEITSIMVRSRQTASANTNRK